jgi:hypothetical protein
VAQVCRHYLQATCLHGSVTIADLRVCKGTYSVEKIFYSFMYTYMCVCMYVCVCVCVCACVHVYIHILLRFELFSYIIKQLFYFIIIIIIF